MDVTAEELDRLEKLVNGEDGEEFLVNAYTLVPRMIGEIRRHRWCDDPDLHGDYCRCRSCE